MQTRTVLLASIIVVTGISAGIAKDAPQSEPLAGFAPGAQIIQVSTGRTQIDEIGNVIYSQIRTTQAVRGLRMNLLVPRDNNLKPAILYLPGGGFTSANYLKYHEMRSALATAGFVVAAAEYRVVPDKFPAPLVDGKAAIRYLRAHAADYGIDAARIGVIGDSAGGWLSELVGTTSGEKHFDVGDFLDFPSDVQAAASLYGISDVRNIGAGFPEDIVKVHNSAAATEALLVNGPAFATFAGAPVKDDPINALAASAMGHLDGSKPPFLLMHGSSDQLVSPEQSKQLYEALRHRGDEVDYIVVDGAGHGDVNWYQPAVIDHVVSWFQQNLGAPITGSSKPAGQNANL